MKIELCSFSGYKIYPGRGKKLVKVDGRIFNFLDHKCERSYSMKRNPRKINWTVLYRRKHKKGLMVEEAKKRTRRTTKFQKAIVGATLSDIMARRNETPEFRKAQREEAIRALKEKKRMKEEKKNAERIAAEKAEKAAQKAASKQNKAKTAQKKATPAPKNVRQKAAPRVGGKR